jgi:hypothetical protein
MADQLERLFRILVRRIRDMRPEHLSRPFEVAEILRTFAPYRTTRADVGVEAAEDYEVLVLRLLSGERGFLFADDVMQDDLRRELESGNPDLQALRAYGTAKVTLAQHAMRQVLESAPASAPETRVTEPTPDPAEVSAAFEALQRQLPPTLAELDEAMAAAAPAKPHAPYQARGGRIPDPTADSVQRAPRPGCRFCGQALPDGREVTFCPHCGQNLKVRRCPGCSADVDPAWKFCVSCGRANAVE